MKKWEIANNRTQINKDINTPSSGIENKISVYKLGCSDMQ
jgi:hypothetical protein